LIILPISVAGKQLFVRESGMQWLTAFAQDEKAVEAFIDGLLVSLSTSDSIEDPKIREVFKYVADKNSPLGAATRKVISARSVGENLLVNANTFYTWLEGKSEKMVFTYKLGGTLTEQTALVSEFLQQEYAGRAKCTSAELAGYDVRDPLIVMELGCSVGNLSDSTFTTMAKQLLKEPEIKKSLANGFVYDAQVTAEDRKGVLVLQKTFGAGVFVVWLMIAMSSLFLILLFTPKGVNFIATGVILGVTGLSVVGIGASLSSVSAVLRDTLGKGISTQGMLLGFVGLTVMVLGIVLLARGGEKKTEVEVKEVKELKK